jgi:putative FmdB family regulatory protein
MPLYEYQCQECGEKTEVVQRFDDAPLTTCASCGGALRKMISAPAIQFKGSGFYLTDYGRSGSSSPAKSTAAESKPAADAPSSTPTTKAD